MDLQLSGKTAIVTGGASNIGRAISLTLGREGANVVIADRDEAQANKTAGDIEKAGGRALFVKTDVTSLEAIETLTKQSIEHFGQIHILVNNVGWGISQYFLETEPAYWEKAISLNFRCHLNALKTVLPHMVEKGYGRVVSIGSDAGRVGETKSALYSGCKGGIIALSKAIAREVGRHNITLNVVCPSFVVPPKEEVGEGSIWAGSANSNFTPELVQNIAKGYPLRRLGTGYDIGNAVAFLASDAANFITGQTLSVSGGYTMM